VRLVRPVFQSVTIEVQALNRNSAMSKALRRAAALPGTDWTDRKLEDSDYTVGVESVLDHQMIYDTSADPNQQIREFRLGEESSGTIKYLILAADLNARAGRVLSQPWFTGADQQLQADLCSDWVEPISFILENDGLDGDGLHAALGWETSSNDNVIDFPISDFDQEQAESKS
jgi:hypothetical protein